MNRTAITRTATAIACALIAAPTFAAEALVDFTVENAATIPAPLVEWSGAAEDGRAVFAAAACAECHAAPGFEGESAIGPDLAGVADRLTAGEIRLMIVDPSIPLPDTDMPGYYSVGVFGEAPDELVGRTRLSASEIEALVAWLTTLSGE